MMTVRQLLELLSKFEHDRVVIIQKDAEGNSYSPLFSAESKVAYQEETTWSGTIKYQNLTDEMREQGFTEEDIASKSDRPAVVLCPVN